MSNVYIVPCVNSIPLMVRCRTHSEHTNKRRDKEGKLNEFTYLNFYGCACSSRRQGEREGKKRGKRERKGEREEKGRRGKEGRRGRGKRKRSTFAVHSMTRDIFSLSSFSLSSLSLSLLSPQNYFIISLISPYSTSTRAEPTVRRALAPAPLKKAVKPSSFMILAKQSPVPL
jgi:hypothetical protein